MHPILHQVLKAYRPLYLHGLLRDGPCHLPAATAPNDPAEFMPTSRSRKRALLAALTGLQHSVFHHWSKS